MSVIAPGALLCLAPAACWLLLRAGPCCLASRRPPGGVLHAGGLAMGTLQSNQRGWCLNRCCTAYLALHKCGAEWPPPCCWEPCSEAGVTLLLPHRTHSNTLASLLPAGRGRRLLLGAARAGPIPQGCCRQRPGTQQIQSSECSDSFLGTLGGASSGFSGHGASSFCAPFTDSCLPETHNQGLDGPLSLFLQHVRGLNGRSLNGMCLLASQGVGPHAVVHHSKTAACLSCTIRGLESPSLPIPASFAVPEQALFDHAMSINQSQESGQPSVPVPARGRGPASPDGQSVLM